jgi:hypothetical protein
MYKNWSFLYAWLTTSTWRQVEGHKNLDTRRTKRIWRHTVGHKDMKTYGERTWRHTLDHKDMKKHGGAEELEDTGRITKTWRHALDHKDMKTHGGPQEPEDTRNIRIIIHAWMVTFKSRPFDNEEERVYHTLWRWACVSTRDAVEIFKEKTITSCPSKNKNPLHIRIA